MSELKQGVTLYVAVDGDDANSGGADTPLATLAGARDAIRAMRKRSDGGVTVMVGAGTYYLAETLVLGANDSGREGAPVRYEAADGEKVTLSAGRRLECQWTPFRDGIMMCRLPEAAEGRLAFSQLFVNGKRQDRARWPNADRSNVENFSGYARPAGPIDAEALDPAPEPNDDMTFSGGPARGIEYDAENFTDKQWARPDEAVIHIHQSHHWGNMQWRIKHIDSAGRRVWFGTGGQQMGAKWCNDPCVVDQRSPYFIENVFEELDAPGEWYLDTREGILYVIPEAGVDLAAALVEAPALERIVEFAGTQGSPVRHVTFSGFRIAHTASTFLAEYEVPSPGDWAIHRGGAMLMTGTHDCTVANCWFDAVGGNAVFVSKHNRGCTVTGCTITAAGESAVCFVGSLESTVGSQRNFPFECRAEDNHIHDCGVFGKQIAGAYVSRAKRITVGHNHIHDMPRAGVCIGDGTWGGHVIEYNHVHDTCQETGDHGPFNSWGRDRGWCLSQSHGRGVGPINHAISDMLLDPMETTVIRHNYFRENSGWGIDLDDGSANYDIYNNLCVGVSIKMREGGHRTVRNNIWVNGAKPPSIHCGYEDNNDRYFHNITYVSTAHLKEEHDLDFSSGKGRGEVYMLTRPPANGPWLGEVDRNCFFSDLGEFAAFVRPVEGEPRNYTFDEWRAVGLDEHSVFADPQFVDPANGDYRVQPDSPALAVGFENFQMGQWGVTEAFPQSWWDE